MYSEALRAWFVVTDEGKRLRVADDREGTRLWLTGKEAERAAKEAALAREHDALAKIEQLRAEIERLRGK